MKKALFLVMCVFMSYFTMAQENVKQKEVGVVFSSLNQFGLTYKTGNDKSMWRFNTLFLSGSKMDYTGDNYENSQSTTGFGVKIGKEYRVKTAERLEFRYGADLSFNYSYNKYFEENKAQGYGRMREETRYSPGVNLVLGLNYLISENLILGAEALPYFTYTFGTSNEQETFPIISGNIERDISGFNYGLSTSSVLLSLVYRF